MDRPPPPYRVAIATIMVERFELYQHITPPVEPIPVVYLHLLVDDAILDDLVPRFASAVTGSHGPRPWRGFTHGPQTTAKFP